MTDIKLMLQRLDTLVIFKGIKNDRTFSLLVSTMQDIERGDRTQAIRDYCAFTASLYEDSESLSLYLLRLVLEDENLYILRKGEGAETSRVIEECLASELYTLEELSRLTCEELIERIGYDGFMPRYEIEPLDFSKIYADRVISIAQYGYGIYAKYHVFMVRDGELVPVEYPDRIRLSQLSGYEKERGEVIANTLALLRGKPANNVLLYGDCGTGKSSTVKAITNEYADKGLRLIELKKKQLHEIPNIVKHISRNPLKFIVFIDDLSFSEDDDDFAALKAILEGSVSSTASNLVIYATSNRRHMVRETFSAREGDEVHRNDTMQEMLSLSERFGLRVVFQKPDKKLYLKVVSDLAAQYELDMPEDELFARAEQYALARGGRSPRAAKQLIEMLKGSEE
ncbi:MAG: ATP-binding protein [Ruminococcus sp.]|nr:ATP-binding protein [Ruminococcus sp.]